MILMPLLGITFCIGARRYVKNGTRRYFPGDILEAGYVTPSFLRPAVGNGGGRTSPIGQNVGQEMDGKRQDLATSEPSTIEQRVGVAEYPRFAEGKGEVKGVERGAISSIQTMNPPPTRGRSIAMAYVAHVLRAGPGDEAGSEQVRSRHEMFALRFWLAIHASVWRLGGETVEPATFI